MGDRAWSPQQQAIFAWFAQPEGKPRALVVRARAGTGKTTTIIEGINRAPEGSPLLAAFNKRIAEELTAKIANPRAKAQTLHSIGFGMVRKYWSDSRPDDSRADRIAQIAAGGQDAPKQMAKLIKKLAALGKNMAPLALSDPAGFRRMVDLAHAFECVPDEEWAEDGWDAAQIAQCALSAMEMASRRGKHDSIDFDDMIWLPIFHGWSGARHDLVVIDEAQDMNASQILLAQKVLKAGGRICVVGDDRQAIYGFRGADSGSLDRLKAELGAIELPLTITYRCAKAIVAKAQELVPDYQAAPSAPEGEILGCSEAKIPELAQPGDFILSRKNAPLMRICLALLKGGKRAKIEGRDIGKQLLAVVKKQKAGTIVELLARLESWEEGELERAQSNPRTAEARVEIIRDQREAIEALAEDLVTTAELEQRIASLFDDAAAGAGLIVCSSVHRAKGLESDRAFVLADTLKKGGEEDNIAYVAYTRAKRTLYLARKAAPQLALLPPAAPLPADAILLTGHQRRAILAAPDGAQEEREMQRMEADGDRAQTRREEAAKAEARASQESGPRIKITMADGSQWKGGK